MNELSLFTGAGGGLLGTHLLGWRPIGYVEFNDYCQQVLAARIRDGLLPVAPVFGDIRAFLSDGYAERYRGVAELVTAGFPCQPWSIAGKRQGAEDDRNLWPETAETLRVVRPRWALLENVPGLLGSHGYFGQVLGDLAALGFDAWWGVLGACDAGAPHIRRRIWVVARSANTNGRGQQDGAEFDREEKQAAADGDPRGEHADRLCDVVPHTQRHLLRQQSGRSSRQDRQGPAKPGNDGPRWPVAHSTGIAPPDRDAGEIRRGPKAKQSERRGWWAAEPDVGRVAHGVAHRVDRLRALGNGQVPAVAVLAWEMLTEMMNQ